MRPSSCSKVTRVLGVRILYLNPGSLVPEALWGGPLEETYGEGARRGRYTIL